MYRTEEMGIVGDLSTLWRCGKKTWRGNSSQAHELVIVRLHRVNMVPDTATTVTLLRLARRVLRSCWEMSRACQDFLQAGFSSSLFSSLSSSSSFLSSFSFFSGVSTS
jgi:hypothetical protein